MSNLGTGKIAYYLFSGCEIVATVLAEPGLDASEVRQTALRKGEHLLFCDRPMETPLDRQRKIERAEVRTYPRELVYG